MAKIPRISEAEWQVMDVIWTCSPQTAGDVVAVLAPTSDWTPATIKTMLNRLVRAAAREATGHGQGPRHSSDARRLEAIG